MKPKLLYPLFVITTALSTGLSLPSFSSESATANQHAAELEKSTPASQQLSTGISQVQVEDADLLQQIREQGKQRAAKAAFSLALWSLVPLRLSIATISGFLAGQLLGARPQD
jgi:hypothetical protein